MRFVIFAAALLAHMQIPGLELSLFFRSVRDTVLRATEPGPSTPLTAPASWVGDQPSSASSVRNTTLPC